MCVGLQIINSVFHNCEPPISRHDRDRDAIHFGNKDVLRHLDLSHI